LPDNPVQAVYRSRARLETTSGYYTGKYGPYILARWFKRYELVGSDGLVYPLWLHPNDITTMQAAHDKNPDLGFYLRDHARSWSSNYIAADLRVDVWAARVCLDLYGIDTPTRASRPERRPRAEVEFQYDSQLVASLLEHMKPEDVATELGVTEAFLRTQWHELGIMPTFGLVRSRYSRQKAREQKKKSWVLDLKDQHASTVACAASAWGVTYQTAFMRLRSLGWQKGEQVAGFLAELYGEL
jgi:hypothetical protein